MPLAIMECGPKCKSKRHALEINAAVTKGNLDEVKSYCRLCFSATQISDIYGRTTLHVASSCGKCDVIEWLLTEKNLDATLKDVESGWTALHRAAFYGQLAAFRLLVQFNCDLYSRDHEGLSPLDLLMKNVPANVTYSDKDSNSVYSWGDNTNFTLGHSNEQRRIYPETVEFFRNGVNIKDVVMCKYHSVFMSRGGQVYTCGHGHGGRLGHGDEQTHLVPKQIESLKNEVCVQIAAARDHTLFLVESGLIYSCGLNENHQIGQSTKKSLLPKPISGKILKGRQLKGICAGRFHSVVYTDNAVFTCGLNAGQLGHPKSSDRFCALRQVSALNHKDIIIDKVSCSNAAVVCLTTQGDIYVLHEYQCRKIASKWQDIVKIHVSGGNLDHNTDLDVLREKGGTELTILLQHGSPGKVFVWRASSPVLKRCRWAIRRQIVVQDVCLSSYSMSIVTDNGEAFVGTINPKKSTPKDIHQTSTKGVSSEDDFGKMRLIDLLLKDETEDVLLRRLPNIHRATKIFCDVKGRNFTVLQSLPNLCITDVPSVSASSMVQDCEQMMEEADEFDLIHDVIIKIGGHSWIAHSYILVSRCDYFHKLLAESRKKQDGETPIITVQGVHPDIFEQLLKFIYTDTCDVLTVGAKFELTKYVETEMDEDLFGSLPESICSPHKISAFEALKKKKGMVVKKDEKSTKSSNPVKMLQDLSRKYGIKGLPKRLDAVKYTGGRIELLPNRYLPIPTISFDRHREKELYDVCIQSEDGTEFMCHKCILVARLEYFQSMLGCGWVETSNTKSLTLPVTGEVLEILLDYLYTDKSSIVSDTDNVELLCNVVVVADQMLVIRLKEMCETSLSQLVTFKNVGELLEFSSLYNATQLKASCQQYIHINMAALMEGRYLDILSDDVMNDLMSYYRQQVSAMCRRVITPWDEGPDKAYLEELVQISSTDDSMETPLRKSKSKKRRSRHKSMSEEMDKGQRQRQISISSDISVKSDEEGADVISSPREDVTKVVESEINHKKTSSMPVPIKTPQRGSSWGPSSISPSPGTVWGPSSVSPSPGTVWGPSSVSPSPGTVWPVSQQSVPDSRHQGVDLKKIMEEEDKGKEKQQSSKKRFSWKDVKKQQNKNLHGNRSHGNTIEDTNNNTQQEPVKPVCPWGEVNKVTKSFRDLMVEEKQSENKQIRNPVKTPQKSLVTMETKQRKSADSSTTSGQRSQHSAKSSSNMFSWGLPTSTVQKRKESVPESPVGSPTSSTESVNPWQQKQETASKSLSFTEIVKDEIQKHEMFTRTTNKPLRLIQIEEQAIQELLQYYHAADSVDERITVERIPHAISAPLWTAKQQKQQPHV